MRTLREARDAPIDWHHVHARLAHAAAMTHQALVPSPERSAVVLQERARRLAQPLAVSRQAGAMLELLVFGLSGERYGIETRHVHEVCRFRGLMPVPGVPEFVSGVVSLRGQIVVVFDLRILFGLKPQDATDATRIVVCGGAQPDLGFLADFAIEVVRQPAENLQAAMPAEKDAGSLICGVLPDATIAIDGAALLNDPRLFVDQQRRQ